MKREILSRYTASETMRVIEAMKKIDSNSKGLLFVVDDNMHLRGTLTDGDIRRWIIKTGGLDGEVGLIMNRTPKYIYRKDIDTAQEYMAENKITALPILNSQDKVSDIVFLLDKNKDATNVSAKTLCQVPVVIMAGGQGTRLYPYTKILPKPLIPIGDMPIIERIIEKFCEYGTKSFYATVNYKKSMIMSYFAEQNPNYNMEYIEENNPLGTAGSLCLLSDALTCPFFVTNCDILIQADYADIYRQHIDDKNDITIVVALKNILVPYGVIETGNDGNITAVREKPQLSYLVNTGMYVLNPTVLTKVPRNTFYHMTDLVEQLLKDGMKVGMYPVGEESFLDMGEFEELKKMEEKLNGR